MFSLQPTEQRAFLFLVVPLMFWSLVRGILTPSRSLDEKGQAFCPCVFLLDLNEAEASDLAVLPGVGETLSSRIVDYRNEFGPFETVNDLSAVHGIGPIKLAAIKPYITVLPGTENERMLHQPPVTEGDSHGP